MQQHADLQPTLPCNLAVLRYQQGLSIIEIMVAMLISLILMLGIVQIFVSGKNAYRINSGVNEIQDNQTFLSEYLARVIRLSGYRSTPDGVNFTPTENIFTAGQSFISVVNNSGTNNSDTLSISYQGSGDGAGNPDNRILDCLNNGVDSNSIATSTFSITANNELQCQAVNPSSATPNNTQIIASGVENLQVLLGEDLDGDKSPDRFVEPNHPNLNNNNVVAVRIGLLLRSEDQINPIPDGKAYNILGTSYLAPGDNFLRKQMNLTVQLRNLLGEVQ